MTPQSRTLSCPLLWWRRVDWLKVLLPAAAIFAAVVAWTMLWRTR